MRSAVVIIFMIIATIFALATIAYVVIDLILEKRKKNVSEKEMPMQPQEAVDAEQAAQD